MIPYVVSNPEFVSVPGGGDTISFAKPLAANVGDHIVIAIRAQGSDWTSDWTIPSGFTRVGPSFVPQSQGRVNGIYVHKIVNLQSEPSAYVFKSLNTVGRRLGSVFLVRDAVGVVGSSANYPVTPLNTEPAVAAGYSVADQNGQPGLTLFYGASEFGGENSNVQNTSPIGFTELASSRVPDSSSVSRTYMWLGTKSHTNGQPVTSASIGWAAPAGPHAEMITFQGAIKAAPTGLQGIDGSGNIVRVFVTDANGELNTPVGLIQMPIGYKSVGNMLSQPEFYWAHRGGSASFPEHSLYGYTQSVARFYGALEMSLARTSDGVWFGLHDKSIARTSGLADGTVPNASQQTWADVNAYQITIGAAGAPRPYLKLEDLISVYGASHVIILDPKYETNRINELLDRLKDLYGSDATASNRIILKGYGPSTSELVNAGHARGYHTWGYFYDTDNASYSTEASKWDIVGLNYDADQKYWDQLHNAVPDKRIVGHVCPNQSAVNIARAKGATGFQCSGVASIFAK